MNNGRCVNADWRVQDVKIHAISLCQIRLQVFYAHQLRKSDFSLKTLGP